MSTVIISCGVVYHIGKCFVRVLRIPLHSDFSNLLYTFRERVVNHFA